MEHDAPRGVMSHIVFHPNPKTNLKAKTNSNPNLQNNLKKNFKKRKKNNSTHGSRTLDPCSTIRTPYR